MFRGGSPASGIAAITGGTGVPIKQISGGLPLVKPPTGNMANNGAWTSGTAFDRTILNCFMWFAANQIAAGVAAGWYYATGSSTTVFTVFNNTYTSGIASIPASPTAFVTTGPGATTGATTAVTGQTAPIAANAMGATGALHIDLLMSGTNTAGVKSVNLMFGGSTFHTANMNAARAVGASVIIANQGVTNAQCGWETGAAGVGDVAPLHFGAVDTTTAQNFVASFGTTGAATDWMIAEVVAVYLLA